MSSTGIAGLTLGGGLGWLMSQHGLALDNLISAEVVTADGKALTASAEENPDLFWALRGGGGNFGVVTSFEYRLHPLGPDVTGGLLAHPFEHGREVLQFYREITASLPDELVVFAGLVHAPDGSGRLDAGAKAVQPLKEFGSPAMDAVGPMTYCELNSMLDAAYPKGALNYWKSSFLNELSDAAIDTMLDCFAECPTPMGQLRRLRALWGQDHEPLGLEHMAHGIREAHRLADPWAVVEPPRPLAINVGRGCREGAEQDGEDERGDTQDLEMGQMACRPRGAPPPSDMRGPANRRGLFPGGHRDVQRTHVRDEMTPWARSWRRRVRAVIGLAGASSP